MILTTVRNTAAGLWLAAAEGAQETTGALLDLEPEAVSAQLQEDLAQLKPNVILETVRGWTPALLSFAYRLAVAVIIILIGMKVAGVVKRILKRSFERMNMDVSVSKFLLSAANAVVYALTLFIAADKIGIPSASIIALLGSAGLTVGLALQGSLANVAGGILIMVTRPFGVGDYIVCSGLEGTVHNIGLTYTTLVTADNKKITIPNGSISNTTIVNVTAQDKRRVDIEVGISYSSDMKLAKNILRRIFENHPQVLAEEGVTVFVGSLADSAVMIGGRAWAKTGDYWTVLWDVTEQIKEAFDAEGIEIPFNQMDVNIRNAGAITAPASCKEDR